MINFLDFWLIHALLSHNVVVAIYELFPQIFWDSTDFFTFRMYAGILFVSNWYYFKIVTHWFAHLPGAVLHIFILALLLCKTQEGKDIFCTCFDPLSSSLESLSLYLYFCTCSDPLASGLELLFSSVVSPSPSPSLGVIFLFTKSHLFVFLTFCHFYILSFWLFVFLSFGFFLSFWRFDLSPDKIPPLLCIVYRRIALFKLLEKLTPEKKKSLDLKCNFGWLMVLIQCNQAFRCVADTLIAKSAQVDFLSIVHSLHNQLVAIA